MKKGLFVLIIMMSLNYCTFACSCNFLGPFFKVSKQCDLTVTAKIISKSSWKLEVEIEKTLMGKNDKKSITIIGDKDGASCNKVLTHFLVGQTYAFALTSSNGEYYLSACGEYAVKIENDLVKGMITDDYMDKTNSWPQWNNKTMPEKEFYELFENLGAIPAAPCKKTNRFENSNDLSEKLNKAKEEFETGKVFDYWAFRTAVEDNNLPLVEFFIKNTDILKDDKLADIVLKAVEGGNIDIVDLFLNNGVSANLCDASKFFLVYRAVLFPELLKDLHLAGAELNVQGYGGTTTIMHAVREGCIESIDYLVENDADLKGKSTNGKKVSDYAKFNKRNQKEVIDYLKTKK